MTSATPNPPPITLPTPPHDINVVLLVPESPHSPPRMKDVLDARNYREDVDVSIGM